MIIGSQFFADLAVLALLAFFAMPMFWIVWQTGIAVWSSMIDNVRSWWR